LKTNRFSLDRALRRSLIYAILVAASAFFLVPLAMMILTSVKSPAEIVDLFSFPKAIYYKNFSIAISQIGRGLLNSVCITLPAVLLSSMLGAIAAYPLSQFRFRGDQIVYMVLLSGLFVPYQIVMIPLFQIIRSLHIYDTYLGMWLVHTAYGVPICTFYMRNYFATIPRSLMEASIIDGCTLTGYFFRVLIKLGKPGFSVVVILQARAVWNDLLFGLSLTRSRTVTPVTVELAKYVGQTDIQYGSLMAATLISIIPTVLIFLLFKENFIRGILGGSVKS